MVTSQAASDPVAPARRAPFVLAPFRGLRFDPRSVGDLGSVVSPPYDVLDADTVRDLEAANQRNIVRLILPRRYERPYRAVRRRLDRWRDQGFLRPDPVPALYLYQYTADDRTVRGLVGLVGLRTAEEGIILPHEDVMPGPVHDRTVLMRTTGTNPEPILLVHQGTPALRELLEATSRQRPDADFVAGDGSHHQLWLITEPDRLAELAAALASTRALIADGHHRYAAYLEMQRRERPAGSPSDNSPWDFGLAMLVDQHDYPLTIGPIHRSVAALTLSDVLDLSAERGDHVTSCANRESALGTLSRLGGDRQAPDGTWSASFAVSDGRTWALVTTHGRGERPVDAAVLHEVLFPAWGVADAQVGYHHTIDQALHTTSDQPGIVIAVRPPSLEQVMDSAARGERMPRKSTSFSPKPRMGVVLRDLRDA